MPPLFHPLDKIFITQTFGERPSVYKPMGLAGHNGIDYRTRFVDSPLGKRYVSAAADGTVETLRADTKGYGTHLRIRHIDGSLTLYGHLTKTYVKLGETVQAQQIIGLSGNTGFSSAPHLHFEYRPKQGAQPGYAGATNPKPYMRTDLPKQFWKK